jgi:hypothetical protein
MLAILHAVEHELPLLLQDEAGWQSLYIDYHPPFVERLWRQWGEYRIQLHRIHPCGRGEALFHPHPWPSAMRVLAGDYEMAIGYGQGETPPPIACLLVASADFRYEMTDPHAWHYVRPLNQPSLSVMVTGRPWQPAAPKSRPELRPLLPEQQRVLIHYFRSRYPLPEQA